MDPSLNRVALGRPILSRGKYNFLEYFYANHSIFAWQFLPTLSKLKFLNYFATKNSCVASHADDGET